MASATTPVPVEALAFTTVTFCYWPADDPLLAFSAEVDTPGRSGGTFWTEEDATDSWNAGTDLLQLALSASGGTPDVLFETDLSRQHVKMPYGSASGNSVATINGLVMAWQQPGPTRGS